MLTKNKRRIGIASVAAALLLVPFVAMQFTRDVRWTLSDFGVAGFLLLGTGLACEWVLRTVRRPRSRIAICIGILVLLLLVWLELAVGIFGTPLAGS